MRLKHFLSVFLTLLTLSVGQMWGADQTATFSGWSYSKGITGGTLSGAPTGATASLTTTYTNANQITNGNSQTLTLSGFDGCTITGLSCDIGSNTGGQKKGGGTISISINGSSKGSLTLNKPGSHTSKSVTVTSTVVASKGTIEIEISATESSLYCYSYTITYTAGSGGNTPSTCATPTFSPAAGSYIGTQSVTISSTTSGSTIYYTTNGSDPTTSSSHGTAGAASATVSVSSNQTLKAIAVKEGSTTSEVGTAAYTIISCANDNFDWNLSTNSYTTNGVDEVTWSGTYATMKNTTGSSGISALNYLGGDSNNRTSSRFYSQNAFSITPASGVTISHIVFTATSDNYATAFRTSTWTNATASGSGSYVIVTPTDGTSVISATVGGTCGFTNVNVCYSACQELGQINGSVSWTNPTEAVVTWDKLDDQVSEWALSWSPNTDGSSITSAIADKGTTQKTATVSGLACGTEYTFTFTPTIKSGVCAVETAPTIVETSPKYQITMTGSGTVDNGTFTVNGETAAKVYSCNGTNNVNIVATPATGYELNAWSITKDASSTAISPAAATASTTFSMPAEAVTVGVTFKAKKYAISYKDEGNKDYSGSNLASLPNEHIYNVATALVDGVKDGYSFVGWFTDEDCMVSAGSSIAANSITAATTLYAKWAEAGTKRVTISTPSHGSISVTYTGMESALTSGYRDIDDDTELTITATPADGYQLSSLKIGDDEFTSGNKHTLTAAITISATFSAIEYGITYHLDGGTNHKDNPAKFTIESSAITLGTPTKTGYTFGGWYVNEDLAVGHEASTPAISDASTGAKAFWAKWTANESTITWDANEGSVEPTSSKYTYDGSTVALPTPTRDHYVFDGWFTEVSGGSKITEIGTTNKPEADVTYHAHWHKENYTVTWEVGGSPYTTGVSEANNNADYNNTVTAPTKPNDNSLNACQANGKFMGWSETKILPNDPVNGSSNISALGLFTTTSPAITKNTTFYAVFANGETIHKLAKFDASNITATPATSNTNEWKHSASNILLKLSSGQRYTDGTPKTFTVYKGNGNYAQVTTATGQTVTSIDVECSSDDYKVRSVSSGASIGSAITSGTYPVYPITGTFANPFQLKENNTAQIRIVSITINYDTTAYADYITECAPLTCSAPQSLTSEPGKNGATISWSTQEIGTAAKYQYAVWADGDDEPTSGYSETTELTAEVSGLISDTEYNWKVRTVCTNDDGDSEFAKSTFTTGSVALTFSVPAGVSAVEASTSASALPSAGVPAACGDGCWVFAGWSSDENATSVEYAAGSTYKFNEDKTLYAVYGRPSNTYKLIDMAADLTANENYVLTHYYDEKEYAISGDVHPSYSADALGIDVTSKIEEISGDYYIDSPDAAYVWTFTGSASAGQLYNADKTKYLRLSETPILHTAGENLKFVVDETEGYWTISYGTSYYLRYYTNSTTPDFDRTSEAPTYSVYIYKRQLGTFTTNPDCNGHTVKWYVIDTETPVQTDNDVTACEGLTSLPDVDVADVRCKTTNTVFMGWSETNVGYEPVNAAPADLFTDAADAPAITADKNFYAVFAEATQTGTISKTVKYSVATASTLTTTGTAPKDASAAYSQTYNNGVGQMTKDNSATLTLSGWGTTQITKIVLSMKSNSGSGNGKFSYSTDGGTNYSYLVGSANSGVGFNQAAWNGAWSTSYVDITKNVDITCVEGNDLKIKIEATANSLFCESYEITYDEDVYSFDDYFSECCPQKDITLNGIVENEKVFSAKIASEVVTKACEGETITLDYSENGHYTFNANSWLVYKTGEKNTTVTVTDNQFTMPAYPVTVEATWTPKNYKITIANAEGGSATVVEAYSQESGKWIVPYGSTVTLQATPSDPGHYFSSWTLSPENPSAAIDQAEMEITMPGDFTATPVFGEVTQSALSLVNTNTDKYRLTAKWGSTDTDIDESEMGSIYSGTSIKVTYELIGQHEFVNWNMNNGAFTSFSTEGTTATFNMPETALTIDLNVRAYYTLGLDVNDEEQGSISSVRIKINDNYESQDVEDSYNVHAGEKVEVVATPNENYKFVGWEKTGTTAAYDGSSNTATLTVGTENITLRAVFAAKETKTLTLMVCGKAQETINALEGTSIHSLVSAKSAPALTGYTFEGWSATEDGAVISQSADVTLDDNMPIYAVYKKEAYYEKVTATSGITDGQYLIVYEDGGVAFNGGLATLDASSNTIDVTISNSKIKVSEATVAAEFTIDKDDKTIKSATNKYIGTSSDTNGLTDSNSAMTNTMSIDEDGNFVAVSSGGAYLRYNSASNQERFRYYKSSSYSGQKAIQLYKKIIPEDNESNPSTVVTNGEELVIDETTTLNNLTVEAGGKVSGSGALSVNDLTIKTSLGTINAVIDETVYDNKNGKSGEIVNPDKITATGEVWIEIELTQETQASAGWYAFSVPFPVDAMNGVYYGSTKLVNEKGYAIMSHHGDLRAENKYAWKKYRDILQPGVFYVITVGNTDYKTLRFKKVDGAAIFNANGVISGNDNDQMATQQYTSDVQGVTNADFNWNGLGNPYLETTQVDCGIMLFYDHRGNVFRQRQGTNVQLMVGSAFFYQADGSNITFSNDKDGSIALVPARTPKAIEETIFEVRLNDENGREADNLFLTAREDATNEYEIGRDVAKMSMGTAKCAQMWVPAYGTQLGAADFQLVNGKAEYPLVINTPKAGTYTISTVAQDEADIYLTQDGAIIWNLSMGEYELDLNKGTTNGYGLLLQAKAPQVVTGVEEVQSDKVQCTKVVIDDHVFILRGGQMYDVTGQMIK